MNLTLKSALIELRADGVNLDPIGDLEHILTLDKLSRKISQAFIPGSEMALLRPLLRIGNVTMRRISMGARQFLVDVVSGWIPNDMMMQDMAYLFCMAHSPEDIWALQHNRENFILAVKRWIRTINIPQAELLRKAREFLAEAEKHDAEESDRKPTSGNYRQSVRILSGLLPLPTEYKAKIDAAITSMENEEAEQGTAYGQLVAILVSEYGHTPEYWLWRVSSNEVALLLAARNEKRDQEARAISGAHDDRMQRAHYAFTSYVETVRKQKKEAKP